jgi:PAS domain S-box-containing protein
MKNPANRPEDAAGLRARAEKMLEENAALSQENLEALSPEETRRVLHELYVHQIELEMQNEELLRAQAELDTARARYFDLYDLAPVGYCTVSEKGLILEANLAATALLGVDRSALVQQPISRFILKKDQDIYYLHRKALVETDEPQSFELRMVNGEGVEFWAHLTAKAAQEVDGAPVSRVVMTNITTRKQTQKALQDAFDQIKTLRGIVPICMHCKNIRDDQGYWNQVEVYVRDHSEAEFSHGICPKCAEKLYPEYDLEREDTLENESGLQ